MNGPFGNMFPYTNFHEMNLDWIIQVAKDFLDQYTNIQETIQTGLDNIAAADEQAQADLQNKYEALIDLLDSWYNDHSNDIADQLADALSDLNDWYNEHQDFLDSYVDDSITRFETAANEKAAEAIATIPEDYTEMSNQVINVTQAIHELAASGYEMNVGTFISAIINRTTGEIADNDDGYTYMFHVNQNTDYIAKFFGGNVHRISGANTSYESGMSSVIIYTNQSESQLADEVKTFNSGEYDYIYIQVSASELLPARVLLYNHQTYFSTVREANALQFQSVKNINGTECYYTPIEFEAGAFTSADPDVDKANNVRSEYFEGGCFIINPDKYSIAVAYFNASYEFVEYVTLSEPAVTPEGTFYQDSTFYLPYLYSGYYRIRVSNYNNLTEQFEYLSPDTNTVRLYSDSQEFEVGQVSSSGIGVNNKNLITKPISIKTGETLCITHNDNNFQYAVYGKTGNTYQLLSGGYVKRNTYYSNCNMEYIIRIGKVSAQSAYNNYSGFANSISINTINAKGLSKQFTLITDRITFDRYELISDEMEPSTTCIRGILPNTGNIAVMVNTPQCEFKIVKYRNDTYTLIADWNTYRKEYVGDNLSTYYLFIRYYPSATTITPDHAPYNVKVLTYTYKAIPAKFNEKYFNKTIATLGDSIVQGRYPNNSDSTNDTLEHNFTELIGENFICEADTYGLGGACVYNNDWKSLYLNCENVSGYDYVLILAGTNDCSRDVSESDFKTAYAYVVTTLKANNTEVIAVTPTSRTVEASNELNLTLANYAEYIKTVAANNDIKCIDLYSLTKTNKQFKLSLPDGLHPNEVGHGIIADLLIDNL